MGEVDTWTCGQFLMGETGVCPLRVELSLNPLVDRTLSLSVIRGGCEPRRALGSLFSDVCTCVPNMFIV